MLATLQRANVKPHIRITLNNRLETAAAAIVKRMTIRSKPRVFRPELPFSRTSREEDSAIVARKGAESRVRGQKRTMKSRIEMGRRCQWKGGLRKDGGGRAAQGVISEGLGIGERRHLRWLPASSLIDYLFTILKCCSMSMLMMIFIWTNCSVSTLDHFLFLRSYRALFNLILRDE